MTASPVRLSDVLDLLATPEEAEQDALVRYAAAPVLIIWVDSPPSPYERDHWRCCEVQERIWFRALPRLLSGEWVAYGCAKGGVEPIRISPSLWPHHQCSFYSDEASARDIPDVRFFGISIVRSATSAVRSQTATASMRSKLIRWIEDRARSASGPVKKSDLQAEAREVFGVRNISNNLFRGAWRAADVPAGFRQSGRPKA
jgi:hypothetical protein